MTEVAPSLIERDNARAEMIRHVIAEGFEFVKIYCISEPRTGAEKNLRTREDQERTDLIEAHGAKNIIALQPTLELASQHGGYYGDDPNVKAYFKPKSLLA